MRKIHELHIAMPVNQFFMSHSHAHSFSIIYGCFVLQRQSAELPQTQYGPHRLKYLLSGPFQESSADPCSCPSAFFSASESPLCFPAPMPFLTLLFHCPLDCLHMSEYSRCFETQFRCLASPRI